MEVVSISPLPTGSLLWRASSGACILTVLCKATFVLTLGESPLAAEQDPLNEDDNYWDDDPARSLHSVTDHVPFKTHADLLLVGHAFAPAKRATRSLVTRLVVGEVDKAIEVVCDRYFSLDGRLRDRAPFTRMSLSYERSLGGPGTSNPVGIRRDALDAYGTLQVPNLQPPGAIIAQPSDILGPIGYGPIAPIWPTRRTKLGRHASISSIRDLLASPLPDDIDPTFWNAAPHDQLLNVLRPDERIILENLHPEHPRLVTNLPGIAPRAFVEGRPGGTLELPMTPDTLFIDTDRKIGSMTWRGSFQLEHAAERGRVIVGMEQPGKPLSWSEANRAADRKEKAAAPVQGAPRQRPEIDFPNAKDETDESTNTYTDEGTSSREPKYKALPFGKKASASAIAAPPVTPPPAAPPAAPPPAASEEMKESDPLFQKTARMSQLIHDPHDPKPKLSPMTGLPFTAPDPKPPPPPPLRPAFGLPPRPATPISRSTPAPALSAAAVSNPAAAQPAPPRLYVADPANTWGATPVPSPPVANSPWASGAPPPLPVRGPSVDAGVAVAPPTDASAGLSASKDAPDAAVLTASNAAAGRSGPWYPPRPKGIEEEIAPDSGEAPSSEVSVNDRDLLELLWFEPSSVPRVRRQSQWRELLEEIASRPADPDIEEVSAYRTSVEAEDNRDIFEVIARGQRADGERLNEALTKAIRDNRKFVPPVVLVQGDLAFPFDEGEMLKAYIAAATPLATNDETLKSSIALAKDFLGVPGLTGAPGVAEGLIARIREAFGLGKRPVPADYLETQTTRALLEKRCYQRREVLSGTFLRALFHSSAVIGVSAQALATPAGPGGPPAAAGSRSSSASVAPPAPGQPVATGPLPAYLPDSLAKTLPLFQRFRIRMIAEVHLAVDQMETNPLALKVVALARSVERPVIK